jgi:hypothetical protein
VFLFCDYVLGWIALDLALDLLRETLRPSAISTGLTITTPDPAEHNCSLTSSTPAKPPSPWHF